MPPRRSTRVATAKQKVDKVDSAPAAATTAKKPPLAPPKKGSTAKSTAKKRGAATKSTTSSKKRKTNPSTSADSDNPSLGVIDPEANVKGTIVVLDGEPCDVMLALVDPSKNNDKFFILQCINLEGSDVYAVYSRWGRTGASGQSQQQDFDDLNGATKCFSTKFKQKSGLKWEDRNEPTVGGKYRFVQQDFVVKQGGYRDASWQYWVDDGVDGKPNGWYDYDQDGSIQAERLFTEHSNNESLESRFIDSGIFAYAMDFDKMVQENSSTGTTRRIRRCPKGTKMADDPPKPVKSSKTATKKPPAAKAKASPSVKASISAKKSPGTPIKAAPVQSTPYSAASTKGSHPVDPDVSVLGHSASNYEVVQSDEGVWYDVVLNQCNISANNNKYYRIQMLKESSSGSFHVWQKWGRVGESAKSSSSAMKGPFGNEASAFKEFGKKFRDKTGNAFNSGSFTHKAGKYTPIEIDNDVEVQDETMASLKPKNIVKIEYEPCKLDSKTKDLIETLFSKDMRDDALMKFNLDLKRLPLGVPSQNQIQHGVSILKKIEDKLNGKGTISDTYDSLSSQFYTAIPHSFGRSIPPTISDQSSLQSRFDMCNILLDMYTTNETLRKIETEVKTTVETQPHPADLHYSSLNATLTPVDNKSEEFKAVSDYFSNTKGSNSRSSLLNVWTVDRSNEDKRFKKFSKVDNRRLLWHGTNIAVVAPIITSGLRIMPNSGGRVGAGIYLADMQEKSSQYTSGYGAKYACMFLAEAPLGKMHKVTEDGSHASSLRKAPKGFDSVHAVGSHAPSKWGTIKIEGNDVQIPKSKGSDTKVKSSFHHDEFLVYDEAQVRLRYVLTVKL